MTIPVALRRPAIRAAYVVMRAYWLLARPQLVGVKCILTRGNRVLLVRHSYGRRQWDLPGGSVKRSEPPVEAASREMHEELGVSIHDWTPVGELFVSIDHHRDSLHCFEAEVGDQEITVDRGELDAAGWFAPDQLPPDLGRFVRRILARGSLSPGG